MSHVPTQEQIHERLQLLKDAGWRAALTIFCGDLLRHRGEVWAHIDLDRRQIFIEKMLYNCGVLSGGEYRLVKLAVSLFTTNEEVNLWQILNGLDEECTALAEDAVRNFSGSYSGNFTGQLLRVDSIRSMLMKKPVREFEVQS